MRINNKLFIILSFASVVASCNKKIDLRSWSFDVNADSASYKLGSNTTFKFTGNPDNITFFSGEVGKRYAFKDRLQADGVPQLSFITARNAGVQANSLSLLISNTFPGGVTSSSDPSVITSANWTDITSRATWATTTTSVPSGTIDLSDFAAQGKPVYIAFRYNAVAGSIQNKWTITNFSLRNILADGTSYTIDTLPAFTTVVNYGNTSTLAGWAAKTITNAYPWTLNATSMVITGATTAAAATAPAEAWTITGPINLKKVTPDAGVVIKTMADLKPSTTYTYQSRGNFEATFVASEANADQQQSSMKKVSLTVN
jgi:hypothetical protein